MHVNAREIRILMFQDGFAPRWTGGDKLLGSPRLYNLPQYPWGSVEASNSPGTRQRLE